MDKKQADARKEEIRKEMGRRLKDARINAGLSQKEVNEKMGYNSSATVSHHESGLKSPKAVDMQKLADLYNVPITYFFKPEPKPNELTDEEKKLIENFRKASNKDKEVAKSVLTPESKDLLSLSS